MLHQACRPLTLLIVLPFLGGCPAHVDDIRATGDIARDYTSQKRAEDVLGCVSDGWTKLGDQLPVTNKTSAGWTLIYKEGAWTFGVVDFTPEKNGSRVTYRSGDSRVTSRLVPPIERCI